jgi:oligopeptide transport system ATP-binding protein
LPESSLASPFPVLSVQHLTKHFPVSRSVGDFLSRRSRVIRAVDDVSFSISQGMTLGLVGESGCGKTTIAKMILGIYKPTSGDVLFEGTSVLRKLPRPQRRSVHRNMQPVFQDPAASLDPRMTVGQIIEEPLLIHKEGTRESRRERVMRLLGAVGLRQDNYHRFAHELSGGQQQRVAIARALALNPKLMILDEPVSSLDMSVRAQILNLLKDLQTTYKLTYLFISHDLSVVKYLCDHIAVMYLGKIVEICEKRELFTNPLHPYTRALLDAVPIPDPAKRKQRTALAGAIPSPMNIPSGCRFHTRCPYVIDICSRVEPHLFEVSKGHFVSCHLYPGK